MEQQLQQLKEEALTKIQEATNCQGIERRPCRLSWQERSHH